MNIQGPLLLLGMTATTGVGLGTVAVNSGAINVEDVLGLLADTTNAVSGPVAGAANPPGSTSAPGAPQITTSQTVSVVEPSLAPVTTDGVKYRSSHGSSGGSSSGSPNRGDHEGSDHEGSEHEGSEHEGSEHEGSEGNQ